MKRIYNWKPSLPDGRDYKFYSSNLVPSFVAALTAFIKAYDQGQLGSCTGNGNGRIWAYRYFTETSNLIMPARLFIYYGERFIEGTLATDAGAQVRDGLKAMARWGVPPESLWPYMVKKFAVKPSAKAYAAALKDVALAYKSVPMDLTQIKAALALGNPVVFGFTVFNSFESQEVAQSGIMPLPKKGEKKLGGHCVVWDGYDDETQMLSCANSWGESWGQKGWFKMPYAYLPYCSDPWILTKVAA